MPNNISNAATIQLPPDSTGKQLDAVSYSYYNSTTGATETRYAQALVVVDTAGNAMSVASPYGPGRMPVRDNDLRRMLESILVELRQISLQLGDLTETSALGVQGDF